MNILISKVVLRACAAVALASALLGCAYQASTISVNKQQHEPIKLGAMEFIFVPAGFGSPQARSALASAGYHTGVFDREFHQTVKKVFLANGIDATVVRPGQLDAAPQLPYRMVVRPVSLTVQTGSMGTYSYMNMDITLHQRGVAQPIWAGALSLPMNQGLIHEINYGNFALGVLDGLQASGVAALPKGHAVTPNGNKNYRLDVPTVLNDRSATGG